MEYNVPLTTFDLGIMAFLEGGQIMKEDSFRVTRICKTLGNPITFQIVEQLFKSPKTPTELSRQLKRSISTISGHLRHLRLCDLIRYKGKSGFIHYSVKYKKETEELVSVLRKIVHTSSKDPHQQS